jgi:hypothetical protein
MTGPEETATKRPAWALVAASAALIAVIGLVVMAGGYLTQSLATINASNVVLALAVLVGLVAAVVYFLGKRG